jgi:Histidine kinase
MSTANPLAADAPLPPEVSGRVDGWLWRYRRWPVFTLPWALGRLRTWGGLLACAALPSVGLMLATTSASLMPWGALLQLLLLALLPMVLGPLAGVWVRRQGWPPRRENVALALALLAVALGVLLLSHVAGEPMKQYVAERTGAVDAEGKRKRLVLMIGIHLEAPEAVGSKPAEDPPEAPWPTRLANAVTGGLLLLWLAGGSALWGLQRERQALAALQRERELASAVASRREAEMRLSVLAAQVEPHFLFNTLAGVRSAIATDPARASEMVDRLTDYLRASIPRLRSDAPAQATVSAQFDIVRAYLGLMAARLPRLRFAMHADADLLGACCPPLMLITLAENAVKHGVEPKIGPAHVEVRAERDGPGGLRLSVADDGVGFGAGHGGHAGSGLGLVNLRERLAQLYPGRGRLTLQQRAEGGVLATMHLPLEWSGGVPVGEAAR